MANINIRLIKSVPYRLVRHPVYLGMTIALTGLPIALRSWGGLVGVFLLFLPSEIYRAKVEEKALKQVWGRVGRLCNPDGFHAIICEEIRRDSSSPFYRSLLV